MTEIYFEDIREGDVRELGSYRVPKDEMVAFAHQYDPQPIHVDESAAEDSIYDGIIASGWYTAGVCMQLLVDEFLDHAASVGSLGLDELRWETPVRPSDVISARNEILEVRESTTRDDRGYVKNYLVAHNQDGDEVLSWTATNIFLRKSAAP
ncbi:MaoC family dehydratase [Halegenticoccus tardaugens]|uniref:MaoC family dehydratase n=1 Tax=Halegenticoccus tardaugens TaxID=2071624 RepID=UPI00100AA821|nr:MaoC family dehydratase [Halegenticoccus tardaugens]